MALRRTAASTRRPRSRSVKSWRAALMTAEATTAVARIGSGTAAPSMRDSVMGGISRRAGMGRAARRSLKTAAAQTFPARLCLSLPFSSCDQRGEDVAKAAERRLPPRSGGLFGSDGLCRLDLANLARLPLIVGEELWQCFFDVRRRQHFGEPQRLGEPTRIP